MFKTGSVRKKKVINANFLQKSTSYTRICVWGGYVFVWSNMKEHVNYPRFCSLSPYMFMLIENYNVLKKL